jgi:DNA-binding MarR family transcriptional regulator
MSLRSNTTQIREFVRILAKSINLFDKLNATCCGISISQCQVVLEIGSAEDISLNDLAGLLNLDSSTMSRSINNLVERGLVQRDVDPADRRYVKIKLTTNGSEFYKSMEEQMNLYYERVFESIPAQKRNQVIESLGLFLNALKENKCCQ